MIEEMRGNVMDLQGEGWKVLAGSCLDRLPELADESVDAVVCDPPYELGFMGKSWDSSGIAYDVNVWRECLRVLKPGGHVLAFGGSRTWHRLAVAVEDAGFELRDSIAWLYGSGFPKSLDVSKAIDKLNGKPKPTIEFREFLRLGKKNAGLTSSQIDKALGFTSAVFSPHYVGDNAQIEYPTKEKYAILKELLSLNNSFDYLIEWAEAEREVIGSKTVNGADGTAGGYANGIASIGGHDVNIKRKIDVTAPATAEAQKWAGWGTALKPAFEPVVVGRKPLKGTVAANVLAYGVGGLNIDGTRIDGGERPHILSMSKPSNNAFGDGLNGSRNAGTFTQGRWPSNVILDEYTAELVDQQSGISNSGKSGIRTSDGFNSNAYGTGIGVKAGQPNGEYGDSGGASRFFYIAKANKRDRNEGLDELEEASASVMVDGEEGSAGMNSPRAGAGRTSGAKNFHPTVKPTDLMRQLIRLVTPPGGVVLDPFTGSGSTGKAAILEGMQFIGCELTEDYLPIIQGRIDWAVEQVKADKLKAEQEQAEVLF